jgi:hypothetical protein
MSDGFKPGQVADVSGLYEVRGPRGGDADRQITVVKGRRFPPAEKRGETYELAEPAKHQRPSRR